MTFQTVAIRGILVGLTVLFLWALLGPAFAHDAPTGWKYDFLCCSGVDCRQIVTDRVKTTPKGYEVQNGDHSELIGYGDRRIHQSKDEFYHLCTLAGEDGTQILCLYVPNRGF